MSFLFGILILILLCTILMIFAGAAFTFWYGKTFNNYMDGMLIVIGFFLFTLVLMLLFRKKILVTVFLKNISKILYEENELEKK